ncbi:MAG: GHKL domain-containing protein [Clostridiales bacterium]|nr:GHKL domain-containing protein [Clostridiales bacterium]
MSLYDISYILCNILMMYTLSKFIKIFFDARSIKHPWIERICWGIYLIMISLIYFLHRTPAIIAICNIFCLVLITLNYSSTILKRIIVALIIYVTMAIIEIIFANGFANINASSFERKEDIGTFLLILIRISSYFFVVILEHIIKIKRNIRVSISYKITLLFVLCSMMGILAIIFQVPNLESKFVIKIVILVMVVSLAILYLYDRMTTSHEIELEKERLIQQNHFYDQQLRSMEESMKQMRKLCHDWKNQLYVLEYLIIEQDVKKAENHLHNIKEELEKSVLLAQTGNSVIDSILNYYAQRIDELKIKFTINIKIPKQLKIKSYHMTALFSNLIEDAIEAVEKLEKERWISIDLFYDTGKILFIIENAFDERLINKGEKTSKPDRINHGFGKEKIKEIVMCYQGDMEIKIEKDRYSVSIMLLE